MLSRHVWLCFTIGSNFIIIFSFFEVELRYLFQVPNIAIRYLYTLQSDHHSKSSYHLSLHKDIALVLTMFPVLYITSPWLVCFITESLHFSNLSFTYSAQSVPLIRQPPVRSRYLRLFVLSGPLFVVVGFCLFVVFFRFHIQVWSYGVSLSRSDLSHSVWYSQGPPMSLQMAKISFFLMA